MTDDDILDLEENGKDATIARAASVNHRALKAMPPTVRDEMRRSVRDSVRRQMHAREHLRWLIDGAACIDRLQAIALALGLGYEEDEEGNRRELSRQRLKELEAEASIRFRLLGKVMPELKAVEFRAEDAPDGAPERKLSTRELALKLLHAATQGGADILDFRTGEPVTVEAEEAVEPPPWLR